MAYMAQIIQMDGAIINVQPKNGTDFSLEELQAVVGGLIEIIRLGSDEIMVVNEEGKFVCEVNTTATFFAKARKAIFPTDCIHGNVLVCKDNQVK